MEEMNKDSYSEIDDKVSSAIKESVELISKIKYIDTTPKRLKDIAEKMKVIVLIEDKDEKIEEEGKKIQEELNKINIVLEQNEKITIEEFNNKLSKILLPEIVKSLELSPKNLMKASPFKELGLVKVGSSTAKFPRVKDIYHPIVSESSQELSRSGKNGKSNTFIMTISNSWYWTPSPFILCNAFFYKASTRTHASGFDAADPLLQEICLDTNNEYRWLACILAAATGKKKYFSYRINTEVDPRHHLAAFCEKNKYNAWKCTTPNDWEPGHCWDPGVFFWAWRGIRSIHRVWLFSNRTSWADRWEERLRS